MSQSDRIPAAGIPAVELEERRERLLEQVRARGASGYVLFDQSYIQYFTGFWFLSNERPIAFAQTTSGESAIFVPEFEVARTREEGGFERIDSYTEYPGLEHPMVILGRVLADLGMSGQIAADQDGYPGILGYQGPALSTVTGATVSSISDDDRSDDGAQERQRDRAHPRERALVRARAPTAAGVHPARRNRSGGEPACGTGGDARDARGARRLASAGQLGSSDGASAGYRGQIGRRSAWAHAIAHNIRFEPGDMLVTETGAPVWGYNAELERAMIIGPPTDEQRRLFDHVVAAQQVAFDALRPGVTASDVDGAVHALLRGQRSASVLAAAHGARNRAAQPRGAVSRRRRPHTRSRPAWSSRSSRGSTTTSSADSATPTPCSSSRTASSSSRRTRATSRA